MNKKVNKFEQLSQWISDLLENRIEEEDFSAMQDLIHSDPAYMRYYIEYMSVCAMMEKRNLEGIVRKNVKNPRQAASLEDTSEIILKLMAEEEDAESVEQDGGFVRNRVSTKRHTSFRKNQLQIILLKAAAVILICIGILQLDDLIVNYQPEEPLPKLARVSEQLDCDLRYKGEQLVTDTWLWPGNYHLREGYISLRYHSGAIVVLEAPSVFKLESFDTVYLSYGKIFANIPPQATGFTVNTDNAKVLDLGTEFGVDVGLSGDTDLYVYKGKTALVCSSAEQQQNSQMVTAGNARAVAFQSNMVNAIDLEKDHFVRSIDPETRNLWRGENICLADVVGGGNGFGTGQVEVGIDPDTGIRGGYTIWDRKSESSYVKMTDDRYIDGVFVPNGNGQVISSLSHVFSDCPATNAIHYSDIIFGTGTKGVEGGPDNLTFMNGVQYGTKLNPGISIHANLGITFDLNNFREDIKSLGVGISKFKTELGISEICPGDPHAVFWVLLDGKVCFSKVLLERGIVCSVEVDIADTDRFLTIITTDGGDLDLPEVRSSNSDWCVLAEPKLELELR